MRTLRLYNTMSRSIEEFVPISENAVGIYTCGPTVYNFAHIGNLRTYIGEDILVKTLIAFGYDVKRVMNITDVGHLESDADDGEDKLLLGAKRENKSIKEIAEFYEDVFFDDCEKLGMMRPTVVRRATDCIEQYIDFIKVLEKKGYTYFSGGNVYFDISLFPGYTNLSRAVLDDQIAGSREDVERDSNKKNPQDFVLWFTKSKFENQAMKWDSPWGVGYPGWHLECSVIALENLGERLDIHCGGVDHIAVHHTNEIAQTESYTGKKWVNHWWHAEFLQDDKGKMSKSAGEFVNLDLLIKKGYDPLAYRYYVLGSHYRRQLVFSFENLDQASAAYRKLREKTIEIASDKTGGASVCTAHSGDCVLHGDGLSCAEAQKYLERFYAALADDLNTANALTELYALIKSDIAPQDKVSVIAKMDEVLSLNLLVPFEERSVDANFAAEIERLISERAEAKKAKDYARADEIRERIIAKGVVIKDNKDGTVWELKK